MKHQQQAEKEEQQRIKNLVLNYDLRENEDQEGEDDHLLPVNPNIIIHRTSSPGHEKPTSYHHNRPDFKPGKNGQRARKLQLSDVDWYDKSSSLAGTPNPPGPRGRIPRKTKTWSSRG